MHVEYLPAASLVPRSTYVRELRLELPAEAFERATSRLALVPGHLVVIAISTVAIARGWLPWLVPVLSLVIGVSFAGLTFIAHEALHGAIVGGRIARHVVGWICFLPFTLSPRLWVAWHDRVHHANANLADDPDMYPTLARYRESRRVRVFVDTFALGGRRWRGALSLILGFTVQSAHQLLAASCRGFLQPRALRFAIAETLAGLAVWATVAGLVGFVPFLFAFVIPLLVANVIVMSFILTNHSLSPRVEIDDPLVSGLSVTTPRWLERITLQFGYHVEHHLFPAMTSRNAGMVRDRLVERWPERYQSMALWRALRELHRTARVYKDAVTLVDPRTGCEYPTLLPRAARDATRDHQLAGATDASRRGMGQLVLALPQWWSEHIAAAWSRSRDAAISDWNVRGDHSVSMTSAIVEHALAFGHGARGAFPHLVTWDAVAPQLRADWIRLGNMGTASWDLVAPIIEHEWLRAAQPGGDASPEPRPAA